MARFTHRVMVVEDDVVISLLLETYLRKFGYEVLGPVDCFEEALPLFEQERPDVVLMDVSLLGDRDGIETAQALRAIRHAPIIFLTAYTDPSTLGRIQAFQPHGRLPKPFDSGQLEVMLRSAISASP